MTKSQITKLQKELKAVAEKYGMIIGNSCRYNNDTATFKIEVSSVSEKAEAPEADADTIRWGMARPGTQVRINGDVFTVVKSRRKKYLVADKSGRQYTANFTMCQPA